MYRLFVSNFMSCSRRTDFMRLMVDFRNFANVPKNSTFCPHSAFMCSLWFSEQTAIISLYSINWLVCITETECVYCAVRTGSSTIIRQCSSRRKTGFDPRPISLRFMMGKVALRNVFLRLLQLSAVSFIPPMVHTRLHLRVILIRRANGQSLEGFKKQCSFGNPDTLDKKVLPVFCWDVPVRSRTVAEL